MPKRILVVDDEQHIRSLLEIFLKKKGFDVALASNAEEALETVSIDRGIDLVILDNRMPGLQGIDIVDRLRGSKPGIRILLLTGSISTHHNAVTVDAYLRKPIDLNKLLEMINQTLTASA